MKIGDVEYYGDALLTVDGLVRLYVGDPYDDDGVVQGPVTHGSAQFVGKLAGTSDQAAGSGVIIGQGCKVPNAGRFCSGTAPGQMSVTVASGNIQGEIVVTTNGGQETWSLQLGSWDNYYDLPATRDGLTGQYKEEVAYFAIDGDTIINVDDAGLAWNPTGTTAPNIGMPRGVSGPSVLILL